MTRRARTWITVGVLALLVLFTVIWLVGYIDSHQACRDICSPLAT